MIVSKFLKPLLITLFVCLCILVSEKSVSAEVTSNGNGSNITAAGLGNTYYIGGEGASDNNDGLSKDKPFATLSKATSTINLKGSGSYEIIIQGDTTEAQTVYIGEKSVFVNVTIKNLSDHVYTINRGSNLNDMIVINNNSALFLGDQYRLGDSNIIMNGGSNDSYVKSSIINNNGVLYLYNGVSIKNNKSISSSAINNQNIFNMYGGEISNNSGGSGAVFNAHEFNMYNGRITVNYSTGNGGGVYNKDSFNLYDGNISSNTCAGHGAGVYNNNKFAMHGGIINDNKADTDVGGVASVKSFVMENGSIITNSAYNGQIGGLYIEGSEEDNKITGGNISANKGIGLKVDSLGSIAILGGSITGNTNNGVLVTGHLSLGGDVSIYDNGTKYTGIVLNGKTPYINLVSTLTTVKPIDIMLPFYTKYNVVLTGSINVMAESYSKFKLTNTDYTLNGDGRIISKGEILTYYVGGINASDKNNGLDSKYPYATLEKAASAIGYSSGTIIIQDDLVMYQPAIIHGYVTLKSDGNTHTIKRSTGYSSFQSGNQEISSMIIVYGNLVLGNMNMDTKQNIIFNAYYNFALKGIADTIDIESKGVADVYNGISLQENNKGAAILNKGILRLYGGSINNNQGTFAGGVYNCLGANFVMAGGSIENNYCEGGIVDGVKYGGGGVFNSGNSSFAMIGGSIAHNKSNHLADGVLNDIGSDILIESNAAISEDDEVWLVANVTKDIDLSQQNNGEDITISISSAQLLNQIDKISIKNVHIMAIAAKYIGTNYLGNINNVLGKDVLKKVRDAGKNITISIRDEDGNDQYSWTFAGKDLLESKQEIKDMNLSIKVNAIKNTQLYDLLANSSGSSEDNKGFVISLGQKGDLPSLAKIRIYVGNQEGIKSGDKLFFYVYNSKTHKLESLSYSTTYTVDTDGYITVEILDCSEYVLLTNAPDKDSVTDLFEQISVTASAKTLYLGSSSGKKADINITLPDMLEWNSSKDKTSINAVKITFKSTKPGVVTVNSKGHLTAKSIGKSTISVKITLPDGTSKSYKITITVKDVKKNSGKK